MRLDFSAPINGYDDKPIKVSNAAPADPERGIEAREAEFMTLGTMAIQALNTISEQDKNMPAEQKVHRATLSVLIHKAMKEDGFVNVDQKDIVMMKDQMNTIYAPLPLMRAFEIFDPKVAEVADKAK